MLIVCPACGTGYDLDRERLGAGRTVRCTDCRHSWFAGSEERAGEEPAAPPEAVPPAAAPSEAPELTAVAPGPEASTIDDYWDRPDLDAMREPAPMPTLHVERAAHRRPKPRAALRRSTRRPRRSAPARVATALLLLALAGAGAFAFVEREPVVRAVPDLAGLYALAGLPVNVRGLEFRRVVGRNDVDDGMPVLAVEGDIANVAARTVEMPPLRLALRGAKHEEIYAWILDPPKHAARPGESVHFRARLPAPPSDAKEVVVRFAQKAELALDSRR